jgi:uncharacterized membrane protein
VWLLISEIFPMSVRSRAVAISVFTNFATNVGMTFTFPLIQDSLGNSGNFGIYCGLLVLSAIFVTFRVPETKGKSLEAIEQLFYPTKGVF